MRPLPLLGRGQGTQARKEVKLDDLWRYTTQILGVSGAK